MTVPLVILAIGSIFAGWLGAPEYLWGSRWDHWLQPLFGAAAAHEGAVSTEILVTLLTLGVVAVGIYFAYLKYGRAGIRVEQKDRVGGLLHRLSFNKYYVDEIYDLVLVRPFTDCSRFFAEFIDQLHSAREGDQTVLDRSMVVYGAGISDSNRHLHENLPILVVGKGNGNLPTGRHIRQPRNTPVSNLYLAMLDRMNVRPGRLGDSTGRLDIA